MSYGFIKNEDILAEDYRVSDLFDFSKYQESLRKKVLSLTKSTIIAIVGKFGVGKSTMLYNLSNTGLKDAKWIQFDAWKYPERKDLWEGFILDFADQIDQKKKITKKIDGKNASSKWIDLLTDIASAVSDKIPDEINFLDKFVGVFKKSPATRVFQLQEILLSMINSIKNDLYIVIEDIDRSGDQGVYFLETLKQFLQNNNPNKKIIVFVPMSEDSFYEQNDSYLKSIDVFDFFESPTLELGNFLAELIDFSQCHDDKCLNQVSSFLEYLFLAFPDMTPRKLKLILRKANIAYMNQVEDSHEPDLRVTICIESSKYFQIKSGDKATYFDRFRRENKVISGNVFNTLLWAILNKRTSVTDSKYDQDHENYIERLITNNRSFKFIERKDNNKNSFPSIPWRYDYFPDNEDGGLGITKFYIEY